MMSIRELVFWSLDWLKGKPVKRAYQQVCFVNEHYRESKAQRIIQTNLNTILKYAKQHVPYYTQLKGDRLEDFPVVNKQVIRENQKAFLSDQFHVDQLFYETTSGSTGTPFVIYKDKGKLIRNRADLFFSYGKDGYKIGDRLYYFRVWTKEVLKSPLQSFIQDIKMVDSSNLSEKQIECFLDRIIKDREDKYFLGYASSFESIYRSAVKCNLRNARVKVIYPGSEMISDVARDGLGKMFGCDVFSRYSNQENGFIAQQFVMNSKEYQINAASYWVEILKFESDEPAEEGEKGRIVITDFFNRAMPFIRYDTGDIGAISYHSANTDSPVLLVVEGRRSDMLYNTKGDLISHFIIANEMWKFTELIQYQFIQQGEKIYEVKVNTNGDFTRAEMLVEILKGYLGDDAEIRVIPVSGIPTLQSGKRKYVINNYRR